MPENNNNQVDDKDKLREKAKKFRMALLRQRVVKNKQDEHHVYAPKNLSDLDIGQVFERAGA